MATVTVTFKDLDDANVNVTVDFDPPAKTTEALTPAGDLAMEYITAIRQREAS